jgi:hypothetical protein
MLNRPAVRKPKIHEHAEGNDGNIYVATKQDDFSSHTDFDKGRVFGSKEERDNLVRK